MKTLESYLCGSWKSGTGEPRPLFNPSSAQPLAQCLSGGTDFAAVLTHARQVGGPALRAMSFAQRAAMLKGLSAAIHERREDLILDSISNGGNTRGDAKFDIDGATGTLAAYASLGKRLSSEDSLPDGEGVQLGRTPRFWGQHIMTPRLGAAVHINAFNFPAWGMAEKMACALLAGMPVITKPGTPSALLAYSMAKVMVESGLLPEGSFQFIAGGAGDLLDHMGPQDVLAFTGSAQTGALLKSNKNVLQNNVRMNIEADSLNCAILAADVETDSETYSMFLANVVQDMTQKAGQKCTAVRRILVPAEMQEQVVADLVERLQATKVGDPSNKDNRMGPLASAAQLADVQEGIQALAKVGGIACGGADQLGKDGFFVAPTLVVAKDVRAEVIHSREVFGPVATVLPYSGKVEEAVELCNLGGGGLVASIYSNKRQWTADVTLGIAPWHGRVWLGSDKVEGQALAPGLVLPFMVHGGPGRAGAGEELGGLRGLSLYMQRTAVQGYQGLVARSFGPANKES